jgi:hypothetical protein
VTSKSANDAQGDSPILTNDRPAGAAEADCKRSVRMRPHQGDIGGFQATRCGPAHGDADRCGYQRRAS